MKKGITKEEVVRATRMVNEGMSMMAASRVLDVNYDALRMRLVGKADRLGGSLNPRAVRRTDDTHAIRFSDYPDTITAAVFGDPPPDRLRYIHGDKVQ